MSGSVTIRYTNNSPDTLRFVWLQLDQNLYRPGSKGSMLFPADSRWGVRGFQGGYELSGVQVERSHRHRCTSTTRWAASISTQPIAPRGGKATISMSFAFRVPEHGSDRMGRDGTLYEIAQWYPRMAVYDDIRGWNTDPYFGQGEFYLEYGDIDYSITAPAGYTIAGSGVLQNPADVLTRRAARAPRARARRRTRVRRHHHRAPKRAPRRRRARRPGASARENVRDVAWAGAPDFRWDAANANGVLAQAYYQMAKAGTAWEQAAEQTAWTIRNYSELFSKYPYPQATSVAGPVGGMEYPMFVMVHYGNEATTRSPSSARSTTSMGTSGSRWSSARTSGGTRGMDEGFNTYINAFALERRYPGTNTCTELRRQLAPDGRESHRCAAHDAARSHRRARARRLGYRKPARVLLALRDNVVGTETFDRAFREYTRRWAFKHPSPADFFRTDRERLRDGSWLVLARVLLLDRRARHRHRQRHDAPAGGTELRGDRPAAKHARCPSPCAFGSASTTTSTQDVAICRSRSGRRAIAYEAVIAVKATGDRRATLARGSRSRLERDERRVGHAGSGRRARLRRRRAA